MSERRYSECGCGDGLKGVNAMDFREDGVEEAAVIALTCRGTLGLLVLGPLCGVAWIGSGVCGESGCGRC